MIGLVNRVGQVVLGAVAALVAGSVLAAPYSTPVRDVENPARTPFQENGSITVSPGFGGVLNHPIYGVPVGMRAVIEFVSASCHSPSGNPIIEVLLGVKELTGGGGSITRSSQIPISFQGTNPFSGPAYVGALTTRLYADGTGSGDVVAGVYRANGTGTGNCVISISGHLIDL